MLSQLVAGSVLNPTISVTAPPGTMFYNTTKPVSVIYGNVFLEGTIISDINSVLEVTVANVSFETQALWQAICCGKIALNWILLNSKIKLTSSGGLRYNPSFFNDGDSKIFNDEFPSLYDKRISGTSILLPYVSPLHGVAHYFFTAADGIPTDLANNTSKVQYDVTRVLDTGLSVNGDDIPVTSADSKIVSAYLTFICECHHDIPQGNILIACPEGLFKVNDEIIFHDIGSLPPEITPETVYWVVVSTVTAQGILIKISSVQGGSAIIPSTYFHTLSCSLVLTGRNAGNNPASVIWDLLTNKFYGLGLDSTIGAGNADINVASFQRVLEFFYDAANGKPYGVNCSFQDKTSAKEMINKICEWTDCILTLDNEGKFYLTVNDPARLATSGRMGEAAGDPPQLTQDDFQTFQPKIKTFDDTINEFRGKFISFADNYAALQCFFRNEANIAATGTTRSKDYDLSCFIFPDTVALRLFEIAKRESFPLTTISAVSKIGLITAFVNDIFRIAYPEYGIDDYFKITKKVVDALDASRVKIEWSQCPELMFDLNSTGISQAVPTVPSVAIPGGSLVVENLTFPAGTSLSTARIVAYTVDADSHIVWGLGQENVGSLVYDPGGSYVGGVPTFPNNGDYFIYQHNKIQLNPTTFANEIQANVLGELNVDTY